MPPCRVGRPSFDLSCSGPTRTLLLPLHSPKRISIPSGGDRAVRYPDLVGDFYFMLIYLGIFFYFLFLLV